MPMLHLRKGQEKRTPWWLWSMLVMRSILAGAAAGVLAAGLIFFGFGFIGLEGGNLTERVSNGWAAATFFGVQRGIRLGIGIALGLTLAVFVWNWFTAVFHPRRARPWLAVATAGVVMVANLDSLRRAGGWDEIAALTVAFMALVAAAAVWWVTPWVLRPAEERWTV